MKRRKLTRADRVRIFDANGGVCYLCKCKIQVGERWEAEHPDPLWAGGSDDPSKLKPAHINCHAIKTADETAQRAKEFRQRAAHLGIKKPVSRPIPGSKASGVRKRMNGTVERWT